MSIMTLLETRASSTHYTAIALHSDEAARKRHEEIGFHHGWGAALDQLVALMRLGSRNPCRCLVPVPVATALVSRRGEDRRERVASGGLSGIRDSVRGARSRCGVRVAGAAG